MPASELPLSEQRDYYRIALTYARDVIAKRIPAAKPTVAACHRFIDDLQRWGTKPSSKHPYFFDPDEGSKICRFAERLPHVKGKWARTTVKKPSRLIELSPWQVFILINLFGWLKCDTRKRRFLEAYIEVPRKNGKSVLAAIIGLFMFCMDNEHGAEVYSGATTEKQAWEVFRPAKLMFDSDEAAELRELVEGESWAKSLNTALDHSRFEPLIGKPGDGSSPHCAIADEFHEHDTPDQVDTMQTGMMAREQPLMLIITTAGVNLAGPCWDKREDALKVLTKAIENELMFAIIYTIDLPEHEGEKGDDWTDPKVIAKANPNFGVSIERDIIMAAQRQAVLNPIHATRFKTKNLNVWCSAKLAWMPMPAWLLCGDEQLSLDEFMGKEAWFILDLASKDDIAAFAQLFRKKLKDAWHYYFFSNYYIPEDSVTDEDNPNAAMYRKWVAQGWLTMTEGAEIDFEVIKEDVLDYKNKYQVKELVYDPWRATQLAQQCRVAGATTVELRQVISNMSAPMKEILSAVKGGRFHHNSNPVSTWMFSNVVAKTDAKDNIFPTKQANKRQYKIDGAVAAIMGMARAYAPDDESDIDNWLNAEPVVVKGTT